MAAGGRASLAGRRSIVVVAGRDIVVARGGGGDIVVKAGQVDCCGAAKMVCSHWSHCGESAGSRGAWCGSIASDCRKVQENRAKTKEFCQTQLVNLIVSDPSHRQSIIANPSCIAHPCCCC
jgi:hypothetical protein